ncbi:MAG: hypothetical protein LBU65_12250 [Planctomycetaceae bacterium]|jgi:hypothetical protein|nr:hypothetical protein [Planctomycetaceae bacterium]
MTANNEDAKTDILVTNYVDQHQAKMSNQPSCQSENGVLLLSANAKAVPAPNAAAPTVHKKFRREVFRAIVI